MLLDSVIPTRIHARTFFIHACATRINIFAYARMCRGGDAGSAALWLRDRIANAAIAGNALSDEDRCFAPLYAFGVARPHVVVDIAMTAPCADDLCKAMGRASLSI